MRKSEQAALESVDQTDADHDGLAELGKEFEFNLVETISLSLRMFMRFYCTCKQNLHSSCFSKSLARLAD